MIILDVYKTKENSKVDIEYLKIILGEAFSNELWRRYIIC